MQVARDTVVTFHYELSQVTEDGDVPIENSRDGEPVAVLHGRRNMIVGVERALEGREKHDVFEVEVGPREGYGERRDDAQQRVSKKYFPDARRLKRGMVTQVQTENGARSVTIEKVGSKFVDIDGNHPQAGKTLRFKVEILDVRAATTEEIAHGHAHGAGGHAH